jgi:hypothetical protein
MKPFAPAILAEDRPECPSHVQRNESEKKRPLYAYQPAPTVVRDSPGGEHPGTPAQQLLQARFRALALPTAARDSAVHFTLLAASGMIGNQRLEHSAEPRGKSFGSDTLGGNAGALA